MRILMLALFGVLFPVAALAQPNLLIEDQQNDAPSTYPGAFEVGMFCELFSGAAGRIDGSDTDCYACTPSVGILSTFTDQQTESSRAMLIVANNDSTHEEGSFRPGDYPGASYAWVTSYFAPQSRGIVCIGATLTRVQYPPDALVPTVFSNNFDEVGAYTITKAERDRVVQRVESLPSRDNACAEDAVPLSLEELDLAHVRMWVGETQREWYEVWLDKPE